MSKQQLSADEQFNTKVAASCFDYLLIEMVPMAHRINVELAARDEAIMTEQSRKHLFPKRKYPLKSSESVELADRTKNQNEASKDETSSSMGQSGSTYGDTIGKLTIATKQQQQHPPLAITNAVSVTTTANTGAVLDHSAQAGPGIAEDEDDTSREATMHRLDALGYRVGQGLAEAYSAELPTRPTSQLECIKFICKDVWTRVFRKQIDNLKTNHRGTFVLTDNRFLPIAKVSMDRKQGARGVDPALAQVQTVGSTEHADMK